MESADADTQCSANINMMLHFGNNFKNPPQTDNCTLTRRGLLAYRHPFNQQLLISLKASMVSFPGHILLILQIYTCLHLQAETLAHTHTHTRTHARTKLCTRWAKRLQQEELRERWLTLWKHFLLLTNIKQSERK